MILQFTFTAQLSQSTQTIIITCYCLYKHLIIVITSRWSCHTHLVKPIEGSIITCSTLNTNAFLSINCSLLVLLITTIIITHLIIILL